MNHPGATAFPSSHYLTLTGCADAHVCQVGCEVPSAVGAAQGRESRLFWVQRRWERRREVDVCQIWQGATCVVSGRDKRGSVFLVGRWKDAAFERERRKES